jgi:hypothetical protein
MTSESQPEPAPGRQAAPVPGAGEGDLVRAALDHLRGIQPSGGEAPGSPTVARQKESLREWAGRLGLLLDPEVTIPCHPGGGFLKFIADTIQAGHTLKAERTASTTSRKQ